MNSVHVLQSIRHALIDVSSRVMTRATWSGLEANHAAEDTEFMNIYGLIGSAIERPADDGLAMSPAIAFQCKIIGQKQADPALARLLQGSN